MKEQNISESNKLIAEFMEFKKAIVYTSKGKQYDFDIPKGFTLIKETETTIESEWCEILMEQDSCMIDDLKFHLSWDWLMPVVEKISRIPSHHSNGLYKYLCHVDINPIKGITIEGMYRRNFNAEDEIFIQIYEYSYLENIWLGVVEFIKWYNQNK